jgi:hypothetical protein
MVQDVICYHTERAFIGELSESIRWNTQIQPDKANKISRFMIIGVSSAVL